MQLAIPVAAHWSTSFTILMKKLQPQASAQLFHLTIKYEGLLVRKPARKINGRAASEASLCIELQKRVNDGKKKAACESSLNKMYKFILTLFRYMELIKLDEVCFSYLKIEFLIFSLYLKKRNISTCRKNECS